MTVSPPGYWLLDRMIFLTNKILRIINEKGIEIITNLLKDSNTFTGINTFKGGINVDTINSINGNTTFNSEIFINGNITSNNGIFIGNTLNIDIIEKNSASNITCKNNIIMNNNNIYDVDTIFGNTLNIYDISLKSSILPYITVNDDIRFIKDINVKGDLIVNGSTITVNSQTLTINDRFIVLNANIDNSSINYTDPTGIIIETHNTTKHSRGYLLWTLFDPNDPKNKELNRTWDLSGDNLRGNVLKATTLRGNILESYYSPNISVISDIDMSNNDISNINTLTASDLNIDVIKSNKSTNISVISDIDMSNNDISNINTLTASDLNIDIIKTKALNISVKNTIDMNNNFIINANISALNDSQINVENGIIKSQNLLLGGFNVGKTNAVTFRSWHGLNLLGNTQVVIDSKNTLYLPENNGASFGSNNSIHTKSIIGISGVYKIQNDTQRLLNSQCYLIPPSMVSNVSHLKGTKLFKTIGEQTENIKHLAGYTDTNISINKLKNTLVPTVGQIVDLLTYLDVSMNTIKAGNLKSS